MKNKLFNCLLLSLSLISLTIAPAEINIIPQPNKVIEHQKKSFLLSKKTTILYGPDLKNEATLLANSIKKFTDLQLNINTLKSRSSKRQKNAIILQKKGKSKTIGSYTLAVGKKTIKITAPTTQGVFYGTQSLLQLLPITQHKAVGKKSLRIAGCLIKDQPRFQWRGMMLDVGRHIFATKDIKKFIDWLAFHKMNRFHWHLTEDQGWRIEIKKYPKLTSIGGYRDSTPPYGNRLGSDNKRYGGFYSQKEIKAIVAYAAKRHITIIPEIDMPGHASAAIAAYPELGNSDIKNFNPQVKRLWGVHPYTLSPKESTFQWIDDVLTEVCQLFPSQYIHIGGDEAPKAQWHASPFAQSVMKREGLKNEHKLQAYFIKRMQDILNKKGRKLIGWDEIREGGLAKGVTVMNWRGRNYAIDSIREGHDVVMAPTSHTYFDYYQNHAALELAKGKQFECIAGYLPIQQVYSFEPIPQQFANTTKAKHVLGCQAQLWTEYMKTWSKVEYQAFPRIAAIAEVAWIQPAQKNYQKFEQKLNNILHFYQKDNINYFDKTKKLKIKTLFRSKMTTNMPVYQGHYVEFAFDSKKNTLFWSNRSLKKGDYISIEFPRVIGNKVISIITGKQKKPTQDQLQSAILETSLDGKNWQKVATFTDGKVKVKIKRAKFIRILVTNKQKEWLVIHEIKLSPLKQNK